MSGTVHHRSHRPSPRQHDEPPVCSHRLARALQRAGLRWIPRDGDRFYIPDRGLDDEIFTISNMVVESRTMPAGRLLAFNGTVEWAIDSIMEHEAVWLPNESQLRWALGERFLALRRSGRGWTCEIRLHGGRRVFRHPDAPDAYALAVLATLRRGDELAGG